jgi:hypothetical protein
LGHRGSENSLQGSVAAVEALEWCSSYQVVQLSTQELRGSNGGRGACFTIGHGGEGMAVELSSGQKTEKEMGGGALIAAAGEGLE